MTQAARRTPADVLRQARRRDSDRKRECVIRAVDAMKRDGTPVTFAAVARAAGVSQWLVYADGMREYIEAARTEQAATPRTGQPRQGGVSAASIQTDLALVRQDNSQLRAEVTRLRRALQDRLGAELEGQGAQQLQQRIDELSEDNARLGAENASLKSELLQSCEKVKLLEDDLAAVRTSLKRMMRDGNV
ncbi:DUF6262 family protein [Mycolicibacterium obuense]|nr:DUF6262 family protein [Mycolicibacterium obuense]